MRIYTIVVTPEAADQIARYGRYIEDVAGLPETAERWVQYVYTKIRKLEFSPQRHGLAVENAARNYEIRRQIIGNYLVLYHVNEPSETVHVIGFRHGSRLPRTDELPEGPF